MPARGERRYRAFQRNIFACGLRSRAAFSYIHLAVSRESPPRHAARRHYLPVLAIQPLGAVDDASSTAILRARDIFRQKKGTFALLLASHLER